MRFLFLIFAVYLTGCTTMPAETPCQETVAAKTTGRYVIFNRRDFKAPVGTGIQTKALNSMVSVLGALNGKPMEGINGAVIEFSTKRDAPALPKELSNAGWVIQPEYIHHTFETLYRIVPVEVSETAPAPRPCPPLMDPAPTPTPEPIEQAKSWGVARVRAPEAKALVDTSKVKVCVVDTGADLNHPQGGNIVGSKDFTGKGTAQDGDGHGTHTAGTVAGLGGYGVSRARLLICKGLDDRGAGTTSALAQCLAWCGAQGAQIVSNSWGSPQSDGVINQAIKGLTDKGVYVFVANGNDSGPVNWPAKLSGSNARVFAIAASTSNSQIAAYSSRGPETKFIAPGSSIVSNWPGGGTRTLDGTSMATPHAAAVCAYGIASGKSPCIKARGSVGGYPFPDALATAQ